MDAGQKENLTDGRMNTICYIFRKPTPVFFSIEKVFAEVTKHMRRQIKKVYAPHYSTSLSAILKNMLALRRVKADLYHITGDIHYAVLFLPAKRTILTIHDCVFLYRYSGFKKWLINRLYLKWPARHCRLITTISEKSKQEIVQYSDCDPDKIIVIPNPVPAAIFFEQKQFNEEKPALLFIGSTPNKNLDRVVEAIRGLSCHLRIVGNIPGPVQLTMQQAAIVFSITSGLSEEELAREYAAADIVLFPSLYEGFGLPVLEGQQAGRVVLSSNISPMKDIAGDGACLVDPYNVHEIRNAIVGIVKNKVYREGLIEKGFDNVKRYTAGVIAARYEAVYKQILDNSEISN